MDHFLPITPVINYELPEITNFMQENLNIPENPYTFFNNNISITETLQTNKEVNNTNVTVTPKKIISTTTATTTTVRPKKGRKLKFPEQSRTQKKKKVNTGQEYITNKGKIVEKKVFKGDTFDCKCPKKCAERLSVDQRRAEFEKFWSAGSYETRCALLQGCVKQIDKKRTYTNSNASKRQFSRQYTICNESVCKKMLINTYGISQSRVDVALAKFVGHMPLNDKRGINGGKNKIADSEMDKVRKFFQSLPKTGPKNNIIDGELNLTILYNMFTEKYPNSVSMSRFKKFFYEECNFRFKKIVISKNNEKPCPQFINALNLLKNQVNVDIQQYPNVEYNLSNNQYSYNNIQESSIVNLNTNYLENIIPIATENILENLPTKNITENLTTNNVTQNMTKEHSEKIVIECEPAQLTPRTPKGRKRKFPEQNRELKKKKLNTGQEYINEKGELVEKKIFKGENFDCKCPRKCCERVSVDIRRSEFNKFWTSGSYETRCALLQNYVKQKDKKRSYSNTEKRKYTREYSLYNIPVCKKTLLNTLSISPSRVDIAIAKYSAHKPLNDQRGRQSGGKNRTPDSELDKLRAFFEELPKEDSKNSSAKYLPKNLNLQIIYDLFNAKHPNSVSQSRFKKFFYNECNIRIRKEPKKVDKKPTVNVNTINV